MSTAFTHAAVGITLAQLLPRSFPKVWLSFFLAAVAILPDIDILAFGLGIPYSDPLGHRGFSHSITFAATIAIISSPILIGLGIGKKSKWISLVLVTFLAGVSHGVLDAATDAGLGIGFFIPFSNERYFFPMRPLETSAVSPAAFLSNPDRALKILENEMVWVGLPLLGLTVIFQGIRLQSEYIKRKKMKIYL